MLKYVFKRILWMIPVLLGVVFIVFTINHFTPGDPVVSLLGNNYTQEQYDLTQAELGLDKPFFTQFYNYVKGIVTEFDLGISYSSKRPVRDEIFERFGKTLKLGLLGTCLTVLIGIPFGIVSATKQYSILDYGITTVSILFASIPGFWLALMTVIIFSLNLGWLPASGLDTWKHWILPVVCLGISPVASVTRMTRSSMLEVVRQDYIRTARAKGLSEKMIIHKHALKNALIPVITIVGMQMGMIMGGSILIETIFSIPGLGMLMMTAISSKNYPVIQGGVLVISMSVCIMNLLVDLAYAFVDPRIKSQYTAGKKKKAKHQDETETAKMGVMS